MAAKTSKQTIQEVHQGMFGVVGTEDGGLVADVKDIKRDVKEQNRRVDKIEGKIKKVYGMIIGAALAGGGMGAGFGSWLG